MATTSDFWAKPNPDPKLTEQQAGFLRLAEQGAFLSIVDVLSSADRLRDLDKRLPGSTGTLPALRTRALTLVRPDLVGGVQEPHGTPVGHRGGDRRRPQHRTAGTDLRRGRDDRPPRRRLRARGTRPPCGAACSSARPTPLAITSRGTRARSGSAARRGVDHDDPRDRTGRDVRGAQGRRRRSVRAAGDAPPRRPAVPLGRLERSGAPPGQRRRWDRGHRRRPTDRPARRLPGPVRRQLRGRARITSTPALRSAVPDAGPLRRPVRRLPLARNASNRSRRCRPSRRSAGSNRSPPRSSSAACRGRSRASAMMPWRSSCAATTTSTTPTVTAAGAVAVPRPGRSGPV